MEAQIQEATNLYPSALGLLLILVCLTWLLPRQHAFCPVLIMIGLMPMGQQIVVFGLHFHLFRILLLSGVLRVISRGEAAKLRLTRIDKLLVWWVAVSMVFGTLTEPSVELFINRSGDAYNAIGCYFFVRCVITDFDDVITHVRTLAFICLPIAALMMVERTTSHNLLSVFGGVPEITVMRNGHLRCQGAFRHPILAGVFGATQFPLFFALWRYSRRYYRLLALTAMGASLVIVICASSSGAIIGLVTGIIGLALWKLRNSLRLIRWGVFAAILGLAMVMEAPVWYLLAKLGFLMGGTGWHRAWLIDQAVAHFDEWWLFGTMYTAHWGPGGEVIAADSNMMDITNHYIMEGVKGGIIKLGLFIAIIVSCFRSIGRRLNVEAPNSSEQFFVWGLGVAFFSHCLSFISANYFDQTILIWYWLQAAICYLGSPSSSSSKFLGDAPSPSIAETWRYSIPRLVSSSPYQVTGSRKNDPTRPPYLITDTNDSQAEPQVSPRHRHLPIRDQSITSIVKIRQWKYFTPQGGNST